MNILEMEDTIKGLPDEVLMQQAEQPSGQLPQYLLISEVQRRADMRKRYEQQMQKTEPTVAEQILQEGIAGVAPAPEQMQQAMNGAPPPMQPPMNGAPPPMPGPAPGPMPGPSLGPPSPMMPQGMYHGGVARMQGGREIPGMVREKVQQMEPMPNAFIEDGSKFNPVNLANISSTEMAMMQPTNISVPSIVPMAYGGAVRMQEGREIERPYEKAMREYRERGGTKEAQESIASKYGPKILEAILSGGGRGNIFENPFPEIDISPQEVPTATAVPDLSVDPASVSRVESLVSAVESNGTPVDGLGEFYARVGGDQVGGVETRPADLPSPTGSISLDEQRANIKRQQELLRQRKGKEKEELSPVTDMSELLSQFQDIRERSRDISHPYQGLEQFITRSEERSKRAREEAKRDATTAALGQVFAGIGRGDTSGGVAKGTEAMLEIKKEGREIAREEDKLTELYQMKMLEAGTDLEKQQFSRELETLIGMSSVLKAMSVEKNEHMRLMKLWLEQPNILRKLMQDAADKGALTTTEQMIEVLKTMRVDVGAGSSIALGANTTGSRFDITQVR